MSFRKSYGLVLVGFGRFCILALSLVLVGFGRFWLVLVGFGWFWLVEANPNGKIVKVSK